MIRLLFGLVVAACVITLLAVMARAVYRAVRPQGPVLALAAAAGSVFVAYAFLGALAR